ncbi:MAG: ATP-dependent helicase/nuclease subunit A [Planctomycetota bacterium]|jgi:ATP-dependent helicase/nuclease subunit A
MSLRPHLVVRASAGTGKTHLLALRFLALLFHGVSPERILATTFTKKAAGEILERVLERLVDAARDPQATQELAHQLDGMAPGVTQARCEDLVNSLAKQLDRFQVRTLDSFFAQITRLYAYELGLPPEWRVADAAELAEQSEDAIAKLLLDDDSDKARLHTLELLRELQSNAPANSVTDSLHNIIGAGLEMWNEASDEAWDQIPLPTALDAGELSRLLLDYENQELPKTAKGKENANWVKARTAEIQAFQEERWLDAISKGITGKVAAGETLYYKKDIEEDLRDLLGPLIEHASHHLIQRLIDSNRAARNLLGRYQAELSSLQRDSGVLGFGDVPRAIAPRHGGAPLSERELDMWFRLDGRVDHLLLDEFQDTSPVQWRILDNIASEIRSEYEGERTFFCVGDGKQSIYGFRHAEPRLLEKVHKDAGDNTDELRHSFRSAAELLDSINQLFSTANRNNAVCVVDGADAQPVEKAADEFTDSYQLHESARHGLQGSVLILEPSIDEEAEEPADNKSLIVELTARRVQALTEAAPAGTVAVLLRERALIPRLLLLLDKLGVRASGEGGNPLTDSRSVVEVLALLHFADHPGDTAAAFHVASCGLGERFALAHGNSSEEREAVALDLRRQLQDLGLGAFLGTLEDFVVAQQDAWQLGRYRQLLDLAHAFGERGPCRPGEFVRFVRRTNVESSTPALVKVMTIHASKGLGFDSVILPELDKPMIGRKPSFLVDRPEADGDIKSVSHCPSAAIRQCSPELQELWGLHVERTIRESFCLLYVAMTRAKRRLELIAAPSKPPTKSPSKDSGNVNKLTWATLVRAAFPMPNTDEPIEPSPPGAVTLYASPTANTNAWANGIDHAPAAPKADTQQLPPGLGLPTGLTNPNPTSASKRKATERTPAERLTPRTSSGLQVGTLVHLLMEQVEWLEEFSATDEELSVLLSLASHDAKLHSTAISIFRKALEHDDVIGILSAAKRSGDTTVWRERRFCLRPQSGPAAGRLIEGAMDRVHLISTNGRLLGAEVIDYKTTSSDSGSDHSAQLELYRHVLATQLQLDPETIQAGVLHLIDGKLDWL